MTAAPASRPDVRVAAALATAALIGGAIGAGYGYAVGAAAAAMPATYAVAWIGSRITVARVGAALVCLAIALEPCNGLRFGGLTYGDVLLVASAPVLVFAAVSRRERLPSWFWVGAGVLLLAVVASEAFIPLAKPLLLINNANLATGAADTAGSLTIASRFLFASVFTTLVVALAARFVGVRPLLSAWLAGSALSATVGVLAAWTAFDFQEALTGVQYFTVDYRGVGGRYTGLSVHPTQFGVTAMLALPVALSRMVDRRSFAIYAPLAGLLVCAALLSGSRAALASAVVGTIVVVALVPATRRWVAAWAVGGGVAVQAFVPSLSALSAVQRLLGGAGASTSDAARSESISEAIAVTMQRPLTGWGFDTVKGAHDLPLQLLTAGGVIALAGWALIVGGAVLGTWRGRRDPSSAAVLASLLALLVAGLSMNAILDRWIYVPVGLALAYGAGWMTQ